ncbi:hypothetical protein HZA38_04455 [Candidatus Peregrinibacteria bacterium]|nr:hypothetical protein [Candidatus Peregrinibacteria bacterium]
MHFHKTQKNIVGILAIFAVCGGIFLASPAYSVEIEEKLQYVHVSLPNPSSPITINPFVDPKIWPDKETFEIHGTAEQGKFINLYAWALVPGTDGNTNSDEVITNFDGKIIDPNKVELSWRPRTLFTQEYADEQFSHVGTTCEMLKTRCIPKDGEELGRIPTSTDPDDLINGPCPDGNVPSAQNCELSKKFTVYHEIVKPHLAVQGDERAKIDLTLPGNTWTDRGGNIQTLSYEIDNNTLLLHPQCSRRIETDTIPICHIPEALGEAGEPETLVVKDPSLGLAADEDNLFAVHDLHLGDLMVSHANCSNDPSNPSPCDCPTDQSHCQPEYTPGGWLYERGPLPQKNPDETPGPKPLLTTDLREIEYHKLFVDNPDAYKPYIDPVPEMPLEKLWEDKIISPGKYFPNITQNSYSSMYVFTYSNYARAKKKFVDTTTYFAYAFYPIKDKTVLVDAFDQYELRALEESKYLAQEGVTRENSILLKVIKDPSLEKDEIKYDEYPGKLDPTKGYYFSIFELREGGQIKLPKFITNPIDTEAPVSQDHCFVDAVTEWRGTKPCPSILGHMITATNEVYVPPLTQDSVSGKAVRQIPSPEKVEWEIYERKGEYTNDPIVSDVNGTLKTGVNGDEIIAIPKMQMNRFAVHHFITGTYPSDDTRQTSNKSSTFFLGSQGVQKTFFNINTLVSSAVSFTQAVDPYGVVFDFHTKQIVPNVHVALNGNLIRFEEKFSSVQKTSDDGLFSFLVEPGIYFLDVLEVNGRTNNFVYPSTSYPPISDDDIKNKKNLNCGTDSIFSDIYCQKNLPIEVGKEIQHRDIPIEAPLRGNVIGGEKSMKVVLSEGGKEIDSAWTVPNGNFSFYVSPGKYVITKILDQFGKNLLSEEVEVEVQKDQATGKAVLSDIISVSLE